VLAQRARQVGLPHAGRAGDEDVAVFGDPPPGGELPHQCSIEFAARRVFEILERRLGHAQLGLFETTAELRTTNEAVRTRS